MDPQPVCHRRIRCHDGGVRRATDDRAERFCARGHRHTRKPWRGRAQRRRSGHQSAARGSDSRGREAGVLLRALTATHRFFRQEPQRQRCERLELPEQRHQRLRQDEGEVPGKLIAPSRLQRPSQVWFQGLLAELPRRARRSVSLLLRSDPLPERHREGPAELPDRDQRLLWW